MKTSTKSRTKERLVLRLSAVLRDPNGPPCRGTPRHRSELDAPLSDFRRDLVLLQRRPSANLGRQSIGERLAKNLRRILPNAQSAERLPALVVPAPGPLLRLHHPDRQHARARGRPTSSSWQCCAACSRRSSKRKAFRPGSGSRCRCHEGVPRVFVALSALAQHDGRCLASWPRPAWADRPARRRLSPRRTIAYYEQFADMVLLPGIGEGNDHARADTLTAIARLRHAIVHGDHAQHAICGAAQRSAFRSIGPRAVLSLGARGGADDDCASGGALAAFRKAARGDAAHRVAHHADDVHLAGVVAICTISAG